MANTNQPTLVVADDTVLRPWRIEDAPVAIRAFQDPDIRRWHVRSLANLTAAEEWIAAGLSGWDDETSATWAIVQAGTDTVRGRVSMYTSLSDGLGEVAYWVLPEARGRGLATAATIATTRWAHQLGIQRVHLEHSVHNQGSKRVAQRAGFQAEGIARGATIHADGWHDMQVHAHLATDPTCS